MQVNDKGSCPVVTAGVGDEASGLIWLSQLLSGDIISPGANERLRTKAEVLNLGSN